MTDEQLLTAAAKAVGYTVAALDRSDLTGGEWVATIEMDGQNYNWAPHISDAVAFRLAVDLGISVSFGEDWTMAAKVHSFSSDIEDIDVTEDHDDHPDKYAATRYAVVRAAAAIGREADRQQ